MHLKMTLELQTFNKAAYNQLFESWLHQQISRLAAQYLLATAIDLIAGQTGTYRVWSGASAATFLHLANEIKSTIPITQGNSTGIAYGKRFSDGGIEIDKGIGRFFYSTDLPHLIYNEYHNANQDPDRALFSRLKHPGPYGFQKAGFRAVEHALDGMDPLPSPFLARKFRVKTVG